MKPIQDIGWPLLVPQDRRERQHLPGAVLDALRPEVLAHIEESLAESGAESFWRLEESVLASFRLAASHVVAAVLVLVDRDGRWVQAATDLARDMTDCVVCATAASARHRCASSAGRGC